MMSSGSNGTFRWIETKGLEDVIVAHKDRAATLWYEKLQPDDFADLAALG